VTLQPEPIPLDVKIVLLGEPWLYYLMAHYDPDFRELFKVAADFASSLDRDEDSALQYARLVAGVSQRENLRPLDRDAVARVVEHGARLAGDAEKLTAHMATIADLVREADFWAQQDGAEVTGRAHVQKAIAQGIFRSDRIRERIQEEILRETLVVRTEGEGVGEVNGLAVYQLDHFAFGKPSRISCRVRMGKGQVVDIEREVELGGPLHSKGVMILSSFLSGRYLPDMPLALQASLVFEQSYGGVDGDSASSTELYVLLSALSGIPLKQSLAVTGSVDQHGRVQAIGGVNEKVEGFFDVCAARGLSGEQGVLIPSSNVKHLMLRDDVVQACRDGTFAIYPVETIDQGIEILTGRPAGERDTKGEFPIGSVNRAVEKTLLSYAKKARAFSRDQAKRNGKGHQEER
jgi:lon-related putative ATP-dependent protease